MEHTILGARGAKCARASVMRDLRRPWSELREERAAKRGLPLC